MNYLSLFIFVLFFFGAPLFSYAAPLGELVTCGNEVQTFSKVVDGVDSVCTVGECTVCDMQVLLLKVLDVVIILVAFLVMGIALSAGFKLLTQGARPEAYAGAKKMLLDVVIGLALVLTAWLIVDTIMKTLYAEDGGANWGPWNSFLCKNNDGEKEHCVKKIDTAHLVGVVYGADDYFDEGANYTCEQMGGFCYAKETERNNRRGLLLLGNASCPNNTDVCYAPKNTGTDCTMTGEKEGKAGLCIPETFCSIAGQESATCGKELVCCPRGQGLGTRADFSKIAVPSPQAVAQLQAKGIDFTSVYYNGTNPLKQGVVDDLIKMDGLCKGCIKINSLTGHKNKSSRHLFGEKSDLDYASAKPYIAPVERGSANGWEYIGNRGGGYPGPQYYNASLGMVCVDEEAGKKDPGTYGAGKAGRAGNHFDCCHNWGNATCR